MRAPSTTTSRNPLREPGTSAGLPQRASVRCRTGAIRSPSSRPAGVSRHPPRVQQLLPGGVPAQSPRLPATDPYWRGASPAEAAERLDVPTSLITGWHDALVDQTFGQYERLRRAGCETALLVGPWTHTSALQQGWPEVLAESLAWLRAHLYADPSGLRPTAVRVHLGGDDTWRNLDAWPPAATATSWHPGPDGQLTPQAPTDSAPLTTFHYDPAEPTPSLGGPLLSRTAGPRDPRALEARDDVLTFTTPPLTEPVDVLGPVSALLSVSTDTGHADVFTRSCDVDPQGRSVNVCDGLGRLRTTEDPPSTTEEAPTTAEEASSTTGQAPSRTIVSMSSTAHRFRVGHRIRWQISGGAHPRYARGTGESSVDATVFEPVRITLHAGSALLLPRDNGPA
nr:CocE/NonD family hydrolase [Streptomyces sp. CB01580]